MSEAASTRIGRNAVESLLARVGAMGVSVLTGILIAKALGPDGKGTYSAVQLSVASIVSFTGGAGTAVTYLLTKCRKTIDDVLPVMGLILAAVTLVAWALLAVWGIRHGAPAVALVGALVLPASIALSWQQAYYTAAGVLRSYNLQQIAMNFAVLTAISVALFAFHANVFVLLIAWGACMYAAAAYFTIDMLRSRTRRRTATIRTNLTEFVRFGAQSGINVFLGLLNYRVDSLILVALAGTASLGIYSVAVSIGELLFLLSRSMTMAITRDIGTRDLKDAARMTATSIRISTAMTVAAAFVVGVVGPPLIALVYGPAFASSATPLRILLPGIVLFASSGTFVSFFLFQLGRPSIVTWWNAAMIAVQASACVLLVPRLGMSGAAAASSVTYLVGAGFNTWYFSRISGVAPADLWFLRRGDLGDIRRAIERMLRRGSSTQGGAAAAPRRERARPETVVLTGAAGQVATLVRPLLGTGYRLRLSDVRPVRDLQGNETFVRADLRSLRALRRLVRGSDAVVHLGGVSRESTFDAAIDTNVRGMHNLLEAARLEGVKRIVLASTAHVMGFYRREQVVGADNRTRPDTFYAVGKICGEALASLYADKFGMEVLSIRIGWVTERPQRQDAVANWVSPRDLAQLIRIGIEHPAVRNDIVYGVSGNAAAPYDCPRSRALGYIPQDRAEEHILPAAERRSDPIEARYQGADFAARDFHGDPVAL